MKKLIIICVTLLGLTAISCKENATSKIKQINLESAKDRDAKISLGGAIIEFDKTEYDFGTIVVGEVIEGVFKITNKGKADLVIISASATCGCTVPEWPKEAIKPGETAELKFQFDSRGRNGKQNKSIILQTNTTKVTETLRVKGNVVPKS